MRILDTILLKLGLVRISRLEDEDNVCTEDGCCGEECSDCPCQNGQPCLRDKANDDPCGEGCECEDTECECFEAGVCCKQKVNQK